MDDEPNLYHGEMCFCFHHFHPFKIGRCGFQLGKSTHIILGNHFSIFFNHRQDFMERNGNKLYLSWVFGIAEAFEAYLWKTNDLWRKNRVSSLKFTYYIAPHLAPEMNGWKMNFFPFGKAWPILGGYVFVFFGSVGFLVNKHGWLENGPMYSR